MTTIFFVLLSVVLFAICVALVAVLAESKAKTWGIIERWREALASRLALRDAEKKLRIVESQLASTRSGFGPIVSRFVREKHAEICQSVGPSNHHQLVHQFSELLSFLDQHGYELDAAQRRALFAEIENSNTRATILAEEKARQAEIKARIREEEKIQREAERAIREAERDAAMKRQALEDAIRLLGDTHSDQIDKLRRELAEAQAKAERTKSLAQQTKSGFVYVISNIGSFGQGVFKIGQTRRQEPLERVDELGDASVPFSFDVHALIASPDAPSLEWKLHQELGVHRVNKVNLRKEFFRVDLDTIIQSVNKHHGTVEYVADAKAVEYFESMAIERERRGELPLLDELSHSPGADAGNVSPDN